MRSLVLALLLAAPLHAADDVLIADFEGDTYGEWKTTGTAFGPGPARGTLPNQMPVSGYLGKGLVNSYYGGDASTGTLTSPPFPVQRRYLNFLIGGGKAPGKTCIDLLIDGKVVRTATGPNDRPGGSERLDWHTWDVGEFAGQTATLRIVDEATGGWGHINIDHIVQSDTKRAAEPASREIAVSKRYLLVPVKTGAAKRRMTFVVGGSTVREFEIELADDKPDFQAFADVGPWAGKTLAVSVDALPGGSKGLANIAASDDPPAGDQAQRPAFHFTSRVGWLNDPNGLVYEGGEWHLYYQHNPYGWDWGNMHWGHAVSRDLVKWTELPQALYPRQFGDWCFSGSAIEDRRNTSGFGTATDPPLVLAYTSTGRGECIAFSRDQGRTWTESDGNPVVKHAGRDPRLVWYEPMKRWVMAVYDEFQGKQWIAFYSSPDLKTWTFASRIVGFFECPDLFILPVAGEMDCRWVLYAADGQYVYGSFKDLEFQVESGKHRVWYGNFYAAQTFSNAPDNRRVQIGWGQGITFPGQPFNQQMTVPCELTLRRTSEGLRMYAYPVKEIASARGKELASWSGELRPGDDPLNGVTGELLDAEATFEPAGEVTFTFRGTAVTYDAAKKEVRCNGRTAPLAPEDGVVRLRVLVDRGSVEVFGNDGRVAISVAALAKPENRALSASAKGGMVKVSALKVFEVRPGKE